MLRWILLAVSVAVCTVILSRIITLHDKDYSAETVSDSPKQIALSFDDGPGEYTEELLDGLYERGAKASFFLVGKRVDNYADTVLRMYNDGHLVGSHSYSHINFRKSSQAEIEDEISRTNEAIRTITGEKPRFIRPPYGAYTDLQLECIDEIAVLWSMCPKDWEHPDDADYICDYIVEHARDGQIVLLHDTKPATVPAVLKAVDILKEEGYEFVRADELLCRGGNMLSSGRGYRFCADDGIVYWF